MLRPDVVTLDVEMPILDGVSTLERIMADCPTPVVMLSNLTADGAETTIRALEIGAIDYFLKPTLANPAGLEQSNGELAKKSSRHPG